MILPRAPLGAWLLLCLAPLDLQAGAGSGLTIRPIEPCLLLDTTATGRLDSGQAWPLFLGDLAQEENCGGLEGSRAIVVRAEISNAQGAGRLLAGSPTGDLRPILTFGAGPEDSVLPFAVVQLCREPGEPGGACPEGDLLIAAEGAAADLRLEIIGLLEAPPVAGSSPLTKEEKGPLAALPEGSATTPFWTVGLDASLSYTDGFVGVGTATPAAEFHVDAGLTGAIVSQPAFFGGETVSNYFEPRYPALFLRRNSGSRGSTLALGNTAGRTYLYGSAGGFKIYDNAEIQRFFLDAEGHLGLGQLADSPAYTLHVGGDVVMRDPTDGKNVFEILPISTSVNGYAGGNAFADTRILRLLTPNQSSTGIKTRGYLTFGSPEVYGTESAYIYGFAGKNIRLGAANDGHRRAEIEVYNDNTSDGKILFRTGLWRDPGNVPGTSVGVRMLIDTGGNVGIGNTAPTEKLEVQGNLKLSGSILSDGDICIGHC